MGTAVSIPSHVCYKTLQKSFPETLFFINLKLILVADRMRIRITSCVIILSFYKYNFFKWEIPKPQWMVNQTPFASFFFKRQIFFFLVCRMSREQQAVARARKAFNTGRSKPLEYRIIQLKNLKRMFYEKQKMISDAIKKDLNKVSGQLEPPESTNTVKFSKQSAFKYQQYYCSCIMEKYEWRKNN